MTSGRTAIIVQARLGSTRLPGKILQRLGDHTVLEHCVARLRKVAGADLVVIATTDKASDDSVAAAATSYGATVFRGDEQDVLARYLGAARAVDADVIMRVTSDCPLIDPEICDAVLKLRAKHDADYAANNMPRLFPHGLDCEAFTRIALERAAQEATDPYDREHVTPWLRRMPGLRRANVTGPGWPANQQRWTLDFPEDLTFFREIFAMLPTDRIPSWQEVLSLIGHQPARATANTRHRVASAMANDLQAPVAVFRFAANARIGTGHAMRCNTLQSRLEALGWRCYWAIDGETAAFLDNTIPPGALLPLTSVDPTAQAAEIGATIGRCDVLVIDNYDVPIAFVQAARAFAERIVYFDDLADRELDADIVVNPTPGFSRAKYAARNKQDAQLLLGPSYALLRQQFAARRRERLPAAREAADISRILVAFGGVDPLNGTALALNVLASHKALAIDVVLGSNAPHLPEVVALIAKLGPRARLLTDVADMSGIMAQADLVIGAPGMSTWERGCLGLPSLLVGIAENQRANAAIVSEAGAGLVSGFLTTQSRDDVQRNLAHDLNLLLAQPDRCRQMALAAGALCDGRGCQRTVTALLPAQKLKDGRALSLRLAEISDEGMLLVWQSAPETRRFALNPKVPDATEHHAWYAAKLASDQDWLLFGAVAENAAGYVRLDWMGEDKGRPQYLISIATAPGWYQLGVGAALLKGARSLAPGAHFYARVLAENTASVALFTQAGYSLAADGYFHSLPPRAKEA
ncbi:UDP-2,4-diacetamido-2,4,6-trideoxy-beta-L-altropyranose hydrolase [Dongia sp.]|uniref:UDP-2,4-diacetamido-2,4, 6-trideoxy-beta-L-altropyranose hydrolase n=1 Tax=Dongia sp. TaxID=1977262 RepID=UPI0035B06E76